VVIQDAEHTDLIPREWVETYGHKSWMGVPLMRREEVIGVLSLDNCEREGGFAPWQVDLAMAMAGQLALALENAELAEQTRARVEELSVLHELSRAVTGQLDQAGLLDTVLQQVARVFNVSHVLILLHDETRDEMEAVLRVRDGTRIDGEPRWYPARGAGLTSVIMATGSPVRTDDYAAECARRGVTSAPEVVGRPHWLGAPMTAGDRVLGVLALGSPERVFTENDERLLANIAQLAALAIRSARLFEERTRAYEELAFTQDQLVRTEKLRALGEMASGVAHDFNNMLAVIVGRAQLMLAEIQDPRHRRWLQVIERSALDGAQTVRRLQEFSRVRRDQPFVAVSLSRIVEEALEATSGRWQEEPRSRGIVVDVIPRLAPDLPPVAGDAAELREALTNLILNAVDAMPQGGTLTLVTAVAEGRVELLVRDTGVGIPEQMREKIFDPFFTTKGPQGTGLGLSMSYGILSRHDARVTVESEEGRGTTFRLSFAPIALTEEAPAEVEALPARGGLRCLVVDDEPDVADVLGDVLASAGHTAVVVGSGAEAIERFRGERFDVVFTDLAMPGLSGWEVARALKSLAPSVPVFLVTGFGVEVSAEAMKASGVEAVLPKPLRIQDTLAALAKVKEK
ncbi:MAG: GAF domain-containing protein, partial [Candidatus Rokubacteria bacterium]|nr:GAF domain-containing protein [Candidatus Rokubacteria bacterium]